MHLRMPPTSLLSAGNACIMSILYWLIIYRFLLPTRGCCASVPHIELLHRTFHFNVAFFGTAFPTFSSLHLSMWQYILTGIYGTSNFCMSHHVTPSWLQKNRSQAPQRNQQGRVSVTFKFIQLPSNNGMNKHLKTLGVTNAVYHCISGILGYLLLRVCILPAWKP